MYKYDGGNNNEKAGFKMVWRKKENLVWPAMDVHEIWNE